MYYFFLILQGIGIAMGAFEILYIFRQPSSRCQKLLLGMMFAVFINSLGYFFELRAPAQAAALQALQFTYFGKAFAPLLFILFILYYCRIRVPKALVAGLTAVHCLILVLVQTCEWNTLYYRSLGFTEEGFFPHLLLGHSVLYYVYTGLLFCYLILVPVAGILHDRKNLDSREHNLMFHLSAILAVMAAGLLLFVSGLTGGYDTTALAYVISETILLRVLTKGNILETLVLAKDYVADNVAQGLVILDPRERLLYVNDSAVRVFPDLRTENAREVIPRVIRLSQSGEPYMDGEQVYKLTRQNVTHGSARICSIYVLDDVTSEYRYAERLQRDVEQKTKEIARMQRSVIGSFAGMVEARDGDTGQHVKRTEEYVRILTDDLREQEAYRPALEEATAQMIVDAAPLHDIGKLSVPDAILTKPGKLTPEEFAKIRTHAEVGAGIIRDTLRDVESPEYLAIATDMARYHHEKWDGSGYPCGLAGEQIPLAARIMAVADVYDALRSERSYKPAFSREQAYAVILEGSGTHFDPGVVEAFTRCREQIEQVSA